MSSDPNRYVETAHRRKDEIGERCAAAAAAHAASRYCGTAARTGTTRIILCLSVRARSKQFMMTEAVWTAAKFDQ